MNNNGGNVGGSQPGDDLITPPVEVVAFDGGLAEAVCRGPDTAPVGVTHDDHCGVAR